MLLNFMIGGRFIDNSLLGTHVPSRCAWANSSLSHANKLSPSGANPWN